MNSSLLKFSFFFLIVIAFWQCTEEKPPHHNLKEKLEDKRDELWYKINSGYGYPDEEFLFASRQCQIDRSEKVSVHCVRQRPQQV